MYDNINPQFEGTQIFGVFGNMSVDRKPLGFDFCCDAHTISYGFEMKLLIIEFMNDVNRIIDILNLKLSSAVK